MGTHAQCILIFPIQRTPPSRVTVSHCRCLRRRPAHRPTYILADVSAEAGHASHRPTMCRRICGTSIVRPGNPSGRRSSHVKSSVSPTGRRPNPPPAGSPRDLTGSTRPNYLAAPSPSPLATIEAGQRSIHRAVGWMRMRPGAACMGHRETGAWMAWRGRPCSHHAHRQTDIRIGRPNRRRDRTAPLVACRPWSHAQLLAPSNLLHASMYASLSLINGHACVHIYSLS